MRETRCPPERQHPASTPGTEKPQTFEVPCPFLRLRILGSVSHACWWRGAAVWHVAGRAGDSAENLRVPGQRPSPRSRAEPPECHCAQDETPWPQAPSVHLGFLIRQVLGTGCEN